nr:MAG TPA: hypothetical protein [Herelleviridae sp.]
MTNRLETIQEVTEEFLGMAYNSLLDEVITEEEYNEEVSFENVYDYVISEAPSECKFLGMNVITNIINNTIEELA